MHAAQRTTIATVHRATQYIIERSAAKSGPRIYIADHIVLVRARTRLEARRAGALALLRAGLLSCSCCGISKESTTA